MVTPLILVIDDDLRYRDLLELSLRQAGYRVTSAGSGEDGLRKLKSMTPDLVLLNLVLPDIDGFEVCRQIRRRSWVPVVIVTGHAEGDFEIRGLELGADDYVTKPFHVSEILARVSAILRRSLHRQDVTVPPFV